MKVTRVKAVIFSIAVAFVSVFFFAYAVQAFYPTPQYEDFCGRASPKFIDNEIDCIANGGMWTDSVNRGEPFPVEGFCDVDFECRNRYESLREVYERNVFFANIAIGIVLFVGAFFLGLEAVSSGLMGGAVMLIIYGSIRYWGELNDVWRTLMLGFALVVLVLLGYRKLKD
jgi:hypothetical protein